LRGRIIKLDNQVKISANLVDTEKETILWSDSYVRKIEDILQLQVELAEDIIDNLSKVMSLDGSYELDQYTDNFDAYKKYLELNSFIKNKWFTTNEDYNELFGKIDEILELDGNYIQVLETKCYFLFEQFGDAVVDANDDYIVDDESRIKTNKISEEILNISNKILNIDNTNKFAIAVTAALSIANSSTITTQLLAYRSAIQKAKTLIIHHPESIVANTFLAILYASLDLLLNKNNELHRAIIYSDKVIEKSKHYINSDNIEFIELICINFGYFLKAEVSSLDDRISLFQDLILINKRNHFITGLLIANRGLFDTRLEKKDFQRAKELANENVTLSKLINSHRLESWTYKDLYKMFYHELNNYSAGLEYLSKALEIQDDEFSIAWNCNYIEKLIDGAQYNKAEEQINLALAKFTNKSDSLRLFNTIGYLNFNLERYHDAVNNYKKAATYFPGIENPTDFDYYRYKIILYYLGSTYFYLEDYDAAITSYKKCLKLVKEQDDWIILVKSQLALTYALMGKNEDSQKYYSQTLTLYNLVDDKPFWTLFKVNQLYNNNGLAMAFLDSSYKRLINVSKRYTDESERQIYLNNDKHNLRIQEEWEKVK